MANHLVLTRDQLGQVFAPRPDTLLRIGIELECGLVDPVTGRSAAYAGEAGSECLLRLLLDALGGEPITEAGVLLGVSLASGAEFSLEAGGALELSSAPSMSLWEAVEETRSLIEHAADVGRRLSIAILPGAILPFTLMAEIPWIPKRRIQIMRDYFRKLGDGGSLAEGVMGLSLSTQTTLDYSTESDLIAKLRLGMLASPVVAAVLVNSPIQAGRPTGALSRRTQFWQKIDSSRCGVLDFALNQTATTSDLIDWALRLPMIYRQQMGGRHVPGGSLTFGEALENGFGDGTWPTAADWHSHLSQVWPNVRVRRTIEMRLPDGPPWPHFGSSSAIWVGLLYDADARSKALTLLDGLSASDVKLAERDVAVRGLAAHIGLYPVRELARELLAYARQGLARKAADMQEPSRIISYLDPIDEVLDTGITFAQAALKRWDGDLGRSASAYVKAYAV